MPRFQSLALPFLLLLSCAVGQAQETGVDKTNQDLSRNDYTQAMFNSGNFERAVCEFTLFTKAKLAKANFKRTLCTGASFNNADLTGADFTGARLENAGFSEALLQGAIFDDTKLAGVSFQSAKLSGASLKNAVGVADVTKADFTNADLRGANLSTAKDYVGNSATFKGARYDSRTKFPQGVDPERAGAVLEKLDPALVKTGEVDVGTPLRFFKAVIYYTKGATKEDAQKLGDFLEKEVPDFTETATQIQLSKAEDGFIVRMNAGLKPGNFVEAEVRKQFQSWDNLLSTKIYTPTTVEVQLCGAGFTPLVLLRSMKETRLFGVSMMVGKTTLYYTGGATKEEATKLGEYLANDEGFDKVELKVQLDKAGGKIAMKMMMKKDSENDPKIVENAGIMMAKIHRKVFPDQAKESIEFHFANEQFKTTRVVPAK